MIYDLVVKGRVVDPIDGVYETNIGIKHGIISKISQDPLNGRRLSLPQSSLILPGFIDPHVHLRQDMSGIWNYKEDFLTGSRAAAHGGVTTVADMPNNPVSAITPEAIIEKINLSKQSIIDTLFYGGVSDNFAKLKPLSKFVCGYKIYAEETTGILPIELNEIEKAVRIISETDKPIVFHAGEKLKEILAICENYNIKVHIAHISGKNEIALIEKYKQRMQLTCEATPHHIFFSKKDKESLGNLSNVNPPIMPEKDRDAVLNALKTGTIDILATDHAPHTKEEKDKGTAGIPHLDTYGPFVSWLIENRFDLQRIAQITSHNAANLLNIGDRGRIQEGHLANLTILDMQKQKIEKLYTKCNWSPFHGYEFPGRVTHTIYHGRIIMQNGEIL